MILFWFPLLRTYKTYTVCTYEQEVVRKDSSPPRMTAEFPTIPRLNMNKVMKIKIMKIKNR